MSTFRIAAALGLLTFAAAAAHPAGADEALRGVRAEVPARVCFNQKERRALVESGAVLRLAAVVHAIRGHLPGTLIQARLCRRGDGYVYLLTALAHDGKVVHLTVDAVKGTLISER